MSWRGETTAAERPHGPDGHHDLRRDVRAGRGHRLGQPRPGLPGHRRAAPRSPRPPSRAIRAGHGNQYPPGPGIPELRAAIAAHQQRFYGLGYDPDTEVLVTAGATEAIAAALLALFEPGDEVIAFEPYYDSYAACIAMAGGVRVPVTLRRAGLPAGPRRAGAAVTPRTRLLLLNSPHNPTGKVFTRDELAAIAELARRARPAGGHRRGLRAPGLRRRAHPDRHAARHARAHRARSPRRGKTFSFTGWKIGWVTALRRAGHRRAHRQAVPHLRQRRPVPARHRRGACGLPRRVLRRHRRRPAGQARPAVRRPGRGGLRRSTGPQGTYFVTTDIRAARRGRRPRVLPRPARAGPAWSPSRPWSSTTTRTPGRPLVRFAFCKTPRGPGRSPRPPR